MSFAVPRLGLAAAVCVRRVVRRGDVMQVIEAVRVQWKRMIEAEYREMPGLSLTKPQMRRFWGLDEQTCDALIECLEHEHFLRRTHHDAYVIAGDAS